MERQSLQSLKIGLSGVRGVVGEALTPQLVASFAAAFGTYCGPRDIVVGTDTRPSREMVTQAVIAGLLSVGCRPINLGIVPVPTLQFHIRRSGAGGGICVTASHNPIEWNALKFFGSNGSALRANQFSELTDLYHQGLYPRVGANEIPEVLEETGSFITHQQAVLKAVDQAAIRARGFKVIVDCCNGAASAYSGPFLETLGCQVVPLHAEPGQPFPRNPEPIREHLQSLCRRMGEEGADVGFAQDADADRLALVDETGTALGEDCTISLAIQHVLQRQATPVVVSLSTSQMVDDAARPFGVPVFRSKVGESYVTEELLLRKGAIGGEGNGGVILPAVNPCRDSFVAMALILEALVHGQTTLSRLRQTLPQYVILKRRIPFRARDVAPFLRLLRHLYRKDEIDLRDGIKVLWPGRWIHIRGSNTEPVLRIIAEAQEKEEAEAMISAVTDYLRPLNS